MKLFFVISIILLVNTFIVKAQTDSLEKRPKVGLVLSGGGAKGFSHIGVLKVLEELGITPDFIGGTSAGSLVGALYSMGYDAAYIENLVRTTNWETYIADKPLRKNLSSEARKRNDKTLISFPYENLSVQIPKGIIEGHRIGNLFTDLCLPFYNNTDFAQLPIPYLCVATDIENGKAVVLNKGYLPDAMRASMTVPTVLTPIEIDGKLLVDGGIVENFPVSRVREMGADIIIGVDLQAPLASRKSLNSALDILAQTVFFYGETSNISNRKLTDIYIKPDIDRFSVGDFEKSDSLIALGEQAARNALPQLLELKKQLSNYANQKQKPPLPKPLENFTVSEIEIAGLKHYSGKLLIGMLQFKKMPFVITPKELQKAIQRAYSSEFFDRITYKIEDAQSNSEIKNNSKKRKKAISSSEIKKVKLLIKVTERPPGLLSAGIHYDIDFGAALLLNFSTHNFFPKSAGFTADFRLGENPRITLEYLLHSKNKQGFSFKTDAIQFQTYAYENDGGRATSLKFSHFTADAMLKSNYFTSLELGAGIQFEAASLQGRDALFQIPKLASHFLNYYAFFDYDTFDNADYPSKGKQVNAELKLISDVGNSVTNFEQQLFFQASYKAAHSINKRLIFIHKVNLGMNQGDSILYQYAFYLGGLGNNYIRGIAPFVGLPFMRFSAKNVLFYRMDWQYEITENHFIIPKMNIANLKQETSELYRSDDLIIGYGLTYSYKSPIGPIELTAMKSNKEKNFQLFFNLGFWF